MSVGLQAEYTWNSPDERYIILEQGTVGQAFSLTHNALVFRVRLKA
jgi:hypothetical protein